MPNCIMDELKLREGTEIARVTYSEWWSGDLNPSGVAAEFRPLTTKPC